MPSRATPAPELGALSAPLRAKLAVSAALVAIASLGVVIPVVLIVDAVRHLVTDSLDWGAAITLVLIALAVAGARGVVQAAALLISHLADAEEQAGTRVAIARKIARVPLGWLTDRSSGQVKKLLQDDVDALHHLVAHSVLDVTAAIATPVFAMIYLFGVDWRLALVVLAPVVLYAVVLVSAYGRGFAAKMAELDESQRRLESTTVEFVEGIQVVRTFGEVGKGHRRFQDAVDDSARIFRNWAMPMARIESAAGTLLSPVVALVVVLGAGIPLVAGGSLSPVGLLPFLMLGLSIGASVLTVGHGARSLVSGRAALARLGDLGAESELETRTDLPPRRSPGDPGHVSVDGVDFAYREGHPVLSDVAFELEPGTITAVVGSSGSGKSTIARLLARFSDPTNGSIRVDGHDLRALSAVELHKKVGSVLQDVQLLRGTVRENLLVADPDAADARLVAVRRAAGIHDRIERAPAGYDSVVGTDVVFSGGEAQRLSIARALLADAPVLLLDEATAFADPDSEAAVQDALATLMAQRTVLVIAHRLHTITAVDRILVLDHGRIVESGRHDELVAAGGTYARLWAANEAAAQRLSPAAEGGAA